MSAQLHRAGPGRSRSGVLLIGLMLAATPALAQVQRSSDYLARMDGDRDGRVSLPEYQRWLSYGFDAMDRDRDGVLSAAELPGGRGRHIERSSHLSALAAAFARQDRDRNGYLSARELSAPPP